MIRVARLLVPALLAGACAPSAPPPPVSAAGAPLAPSPRGVPGPGGAQFASRDALVEACREQATRVVLYRDRGQQMRVDEGESRVGVQASIPTVRAETFRLAQQFERDRLAEECVRQHSGEQPLPQGGAAAPQAAPAPARRAPGRPARGGS